MGFSISRLSALNYILRRVNDLGALAVCVEPPIHLHTLLCGTPGLGEKLALALVDREEELIDLVVFRV